MTNTRKPEWWEAELAADLEACDGVDRALALILLYQELKPRHDNHAHDVAQRVLRATRHIDGRLIRVAVAHTWRPIALAENPALAPWQAEELALACLTRIEPGSGFVIGYGNQGYRKAIRALIQRYGMNARASLGRLLFNIARCHVQTETDMQAGFPRQMLSLLLELPGLDDDRLKILASRWKDDPDWTKAIAEYRGTAE